MELGVEPRRRLDRRTRHLPAAPASHLASSRLDPVLPLDQAGWDEGVRLALRKPASLKTNQLRMSSIILHPTSPIIQVLWRWASDEATGVGTLGVVAADLHTGGSGYWVALHFTADMTTLRKKRSFLRIFGADSATPKYSRKTPHMKLSSVRFLGNTLRLQCPENRVLSERSAALLASGQLP